MVYRSSSSALLALAALASTLSVASAVEFFSPDWIIPLAIGTPYPPMSVNVGDSLTFSWSQGTHDVWIYPSGNCDPTGGVQIGSTQDNPTTYVFGEDTAGTTITFACDVGSHCAAGMIMDVTVQGAAEADDDDDPEGNAVVATVPPTGGLNEGTADPLATAPPTNDDLVPTTGNFGTCYVCGNEEDVITNPDFIVSLPNPGQPNFDVSCANLYQDGLNGFIPDESCGFISQMATIPCGCSPPDFTCNICGDEADMMVRNPDQTLTLPTDPSNQVTCGALATAGANGELSPAECTTATLFAFVPCECAPSNFTCSVCGDGNKANNLEAVIEVPGIDETTTCGGIEASGLSGELSPEACTAVTAYNRVTTTCGCAPEEGYGECLVCGDNSSVPMTPDVELTLALADTDTCQSLYDDGKNGLLGPGRCGAAQAQAAFACNCAPPDYTCNVCGGDGTNTTMLYPDTNFTVPGIGLLVNCGELETAGLDGVINPNDCGLISPLVQAQCGCAPTGYTCNICGEDSGGATVTVGNSTFVPGDETTCAAAEAAGLGGDLDPLRCAIYTPLAQVSCGCEVGGTLAPTNATELSVADETPAPSVPGNGTDAPEVAAVLDDEEDALDVASNATTADKPVADNEPGVAAAPEAAPVSAPVAIPVAEQPGSTDGVTGSGQASVSGATTASSTSRLAMAVAACLFGTVVALL
mmetsp:Transcript_118310/g.241824  ORF Transcript_118310/g.241824 Transcript_118310/m.241824 type:complete len:698 (-) Transcript_118310:214-2307(-)|eukprot:CAMPEP_0201149720 /NCGR_PEP_ID=MMETSP0851-20130426/10960_1 /ASSEMBLY_ACC=CAM_ASM_000631 /TAXON_ID=183588 /ORGANISM="Pseudo-nitzschia fraudulenta, Strain WWA7" /LENGTH=697 /DNA_ID=CAMNT_0047426165 /DNA_START=37 /DNA_END=2130 /DNA_ORIENTATION=+